VYYNGKLSVGGVSAVDIWQDEDLSLDLAAWVHTHGSWMREVDMHFSDINVRGGYGDSVVGLYDDIPGYLANPVGVLKKLYVTQNDLDNLPSRGLNITDPRYVTIVATGVPH
jgi:hypothetical protein